MKQIILSILFLIVSVTYAANPNDFVGKWYTKDNESIVEITLVKNKYNGRIIWIHEPLDKEGKHKSDTNNPEESLRTTPIVGLELLKGFEFDDGELEEGTIYDPNNGKTYSCEMKIEEGTLNVRGYIGFSLLGRTTEWERVPAATKVIVDENDPLKVTVQ